MDVLSDILDVLQLRGTLYFRTAFSPPWSVAVPAYGGAARFHLAAQGRCHVRVGEDQDVTLNPGDLIVIPNGVGHVICDDPEATPLALEDVVQQTGYSGEGVLIYGGDSRPDADTKLICGHFNFAEDAEHPLLKALPPYLLVSAELRARAPWLDELMRLITRQMFTESPGVTASVMRLSEALFIEVVRTCAHQNPALSGIISAMGDPRIGRALNLMHRDFDQSWTLDGIAREVGMSRSRFAEQFQSMMGCAPMSYLSDLRLQKAMNLLSSTSAPVQSIATKVGYQSPAAFSRAFTGRYGRSPSDIRREAV
ncbi:AraC family transcriptional regulator [Pelagibius sp. Alg239-R121]|uniref:AraC family transcriptional regulator n=1 Tax=Pelagibius sp. Alg239-R121 TaxID=2993448 RepID=UPI0024A7804D|nr:AraC family transcriptional regulator [Pelagibius sp. Alg239-R121]